MRSLHPSTVSPLVSVAIELPAASSPYTVPSFTPDPFRLLTSPHIDRRCDPSKLADGHKRWSCHPRCAACACPSHRCSLPLNHGVHCFTHPPNAPLSCAPFALTSRPLRPPTTEVACWCHGASTICPDSDGKAPHPQAEHGSHQH